MKTGVRERNLGKHPAQVCMRDEKKGEKQGGTGIGVTYGPAAYPSKAKLRCSFRELGVTFAMETLSTFTDTAELPMLPSAFVPSYPIRRRRKPSQSGGCRTHPSGCEPYSGRIPIPGKSCWRSSIAMNESRQAGIAGRARQGR